jgi:hypothetical protein
LQTVCRLVFTFLIVLIFNPSAVLAQISMPGGAPTTIVPTDVLTGVMPTGLPTRLPTDVPADVPNDMLTALPAESTTEISPPVGYTPAAQPSNALPDAPARQRVIDKKFVVVMAALGASESLRFTTHKLVLDHEFAAGAPWVTKVTSSPRLTAKYAGIFAMEMLVAYELKKPHSWLPGDKVIRKLWWIYPANMIPIHIKNGVGSIRTQAPAGCPIELCGPQ